MSITLTQNQLNKINDFIIPSTINNFTPNYYGMYDYIFTQFDGKDEVMPKEQQYWFQQAAQINEYLNAVAVDASERTVEQQAIVENPTQSAYFIQQINKESLRIAGGNDSDENIAFISNTIGEKVYGDIISSIKADGSAEIPAIETQVDRDIGAAIEAGGLTLSQWGGAFFFWDTVPGDRTNGLSVGQYIAQQGTVDEFVDMTSTAMARTIDKFSDSLVGDKSSLDALIGAIKTFSTGHSDGLNPLAAFSTQVGVVRKFGLQGVAYDELEQQSDQWVGLRVLFNTLQKSPIAKQIYEESFSGGVEFFLGMTIEDFMEYMTDLAELMNDGVDVREGFTIKDALIQIFDDTTVGEGEKDDDLDGGLWIGIGDDKIFGLSGNDEISGGIGDDILHGGKGNDSLEGGWGSDIIYGGENNDTLIGDSGNDTLVGGTGNDNLYGDKQESGIFSRFIGGGADILLGDTGYDNYHYVMGDNRKSGASWIDNIYDVDGEGQLLVDGKKLQFGKKLNHSL